MNKPLPHSDPPDNFFPIAEKLFHAIESEYVVGATVLVDAIRLPDISCNREKYRDFPEAVLIGRWPEFSHIGVLRAGDLHGKAQSDTGGIDWEIFIEHVPFDNNYSHTEVRIRPVGKSYDEKKKPNSMTLRLKMKGMLAGKITLIPRYPPKSNA